MTDEQKQAIRARYEKCKGQLGADFSALLDALADAEKRVEEIKQQNQHNLNCHVSEYDEKLRFKAIIKDITAGRDRWKARVEALERAISQHYVDMTSTCFTCYSCVNAVDGAKPRLEEGKPYKCAGCGKGHPNWKFDQARFAEK